MQYSVRNFYFITLLILSIGVLLLFVKYEDTIDDAMKSSEKLIISRVEGFSKNIDEMLKKEFPESASDIFNCTLEQIEQLERHLRLFVGEQYRYVYMVAKDEKQRWRYVLDGSKSISEKGEFLQKFSPESPMWDEVFKTQKPQYKIQDKSMGLWLTYLYPVVRDGKTEFVVAFDFAIKEQKEMGKIFSPLRDYLFVISFLLVLILIFSYLLAYLFYKQKQKSSIDPLTSVYNRNFLKDYGEKIDLNNFAIAVIDIDHFKRINDTHGHAVGDIVLRKIAQSIKDSIRGEDILIRHGGEEFLLFLKTSHSDQNISQTANRIKDSISKKDMELENINIKVTASVGVNPSPWMNSSLGDAIVIADKMLYLAKTNGRDRVEIFEHKQNRDVLKKTEDIALAIEEERLFAFFQPISCVETGEIVKYEALARIITKEGKIFYPAQFLPLIRKTTTYRNLSKTMLKEAFWAINTYGISVSINFDTGDFFDETLFEMIYAMLEENKKIAQKLTIELLEDREILDIQAIVSRINSLRELGVSIAIDDFGSGYSTFHYILSIKPDFLKIDGSIIKQLAKNPHAKEVIGAIVQICKTLKIKNIAECVEEEECLEVLKNLGVDFVQGYAIGKPSFALCVC
ncbi:MAG: bifunctional diguanylate cyclase/phosphodiesterase [Sulfurospirillaceae bacterium]|nr:bifunctional diguanylate cyclase/phosphodiesterase [Sulfurospirillaceae bacterium]